MVSHPEREHISKLATEIKTHLDEIEFDSLADVKAEIQKLKDMVERGEHPITGGSIRGDVDVFKEALKSIEENYEKIWERAEAYLAGLRLKASNINELAKFASAAKEKLEEIRGSADYTTKRDAFLIAERLYLVELLDDERDPERWFLGLWKDRYPEYVSALESGANIDDFLAEQVKELKGLGWRGVDERLLTNIFESSYEIDQQLTNILSGAEEGSADVFEDLRSKIDVLRVVVDPTNTGVSETQVFANRLSHKYREAYKKWAFNIGADFVDKDRLKGLLPPEIDKYSLWLADIKEARAFLDDLKSRGVIIADPNQVPENELEKARDLKKSILAGKKFLNHPGIPFEDKRRVDDLFQTVYSEINVFLGEQTEEVGLVYTNDVEWWMTVNHGRQWREVQLLWLQANMGNVGVFSNRDKQLIEKLSTYFTEEISKLDQSDVAFSQRFAALDIQLNRLIALKKMVAEAEEALRQPKTDESESENIRIMKDIYAELRKNNSRLPEFDDLSPENSSEAIRQLWFAIEAHFKGIYNEKTAGPFALPSSGDRVGLWNGEQFAVTGTADKTLEFFFKNFPWKKLNPELSQEDINEWIEMWNMRVVHISMNFNYAAEIRERLGEMHGGDFPRDLVKFTVNKGEDGGLQSDLKFAYSMTWNNPRIAKMVGVKVGELDPTWRKPLIVDQLEALFVRYGVAKNFSFRRNDSLDNLAIVKPKIIASIPPEYRVEGDEAMVENAFNEVFWRSMVMFEVFNMDTNGLSSKMSRAMNGAYGHKVAYGLENTNDRWRYMFLQLKTTVIPRADWIHHFVKLDESMYDVLSWDDVKGIIKDLRDSGNNELAKQYAAFMQDLVERSLGPGDDVEKIEDVIKAINSRYRIVMIKKEYRRMEIEDGHVLPIAIPESYFTYSDQMSARGQMDPGYVAITWRQRLMSGLSPEHVRWDTVTPNNQAAWSKASEDSLVWYEMLDYTKPDAIFTDINNPKLIGKVVKRPVLFPKFKTIDAQLYRLLQVGGFNLANEIDNLLSGLIGVQKIDSDEPTLLLNFAIITKTAARYMVSELTDAGPAWPGQVRMPTAEKWVDMFREEWAGDGEYRDYSHMVREIPGDGKERARRSRTAVLDYVRDAADKYYEGKKFAETQMLIELFWIAIGGYLDQYRYRSYEDGDQLPTPLTDQDLQTAYEQLKPIGGGDLIPMDKRHRELFIKMVEKQFASFYDPRSEFKSDDEMKKYVDIRDKVEGMMRDRGILGSNQQVIADLYFYRFVYPKMQEKPKS